MSSGRTSLRGFLSCVLALASVLVGVSVQAQALRDPTVVPAAVAAAMRPAGAVASKSDNKALSVLVLDGRSFVMSGSRLYALGDKLGSATVERISETQIWLREGKAVRKINLYSGVQRQPHVPANTALDCGLDKRTLPVGVAVITRSGGVKKVGNGRDDSPTPIQDPACKNATQ